jgi:hypothetical protein
MLSIKDSASNFVAQDPFHKELEFKPSFDQYLKAMESAKSVIRVNNDGNHFKRVGPKIRRKDATFEDDEGSSTTKLNKGFKNEYGGKERNFDYKTKQKHGQTVRQDGSKHRSRSFEPKSVDCSVIKSQGENGSGGGIHNNIIRFNSNGVRGGSVVEKEDFGRRERDHSRKGKTLGGDSFVDRKKPMDNGHGKRYSEIESLTNKNGRMNVKSNGSSKHFLNRGYDSDNLEVERAAFKNLEGPNNVTSKAHFSRKDSFVDRKKAMDSGPGKRYNEIESLIHRNRRMNVKLNGSSKRFLNRGYDSDNLVVERAAFKNLEDPNNVISKAHFSHKEMEERIQKLAKQYVVYSFLHGFGISELDKITHSGIQHTHIYFYTEFYFVF